MDRIEVTETLVRSTESGERKVARATGLEPATSGVTGRHSNQLSYARVASRLVSAAVSGV